MIAVVDYGLGNIQAFLSAFRRLDIDAVAVSDRRGLEHVSKIVLPGVGSFDFAMERLEASGMRATLDDLVLQRHIPILGVCVGMQILAGGSDEGRRAGLGWIDGRVRSLRAHATAREVPLPHMGWNWVRPGAASALFEGLEQDARFYFLHSFHFECARPADTLAVCSYAGDFTCAVRAGNVYGVQFHPEKSHHCGMRLLQNFAAL